MFRQLECFIQICKEGSFTKASEVLMVSQPTLSQQIRYLEAEVGTPLFERVGRGVKITAAGEILYEKALSVMRLIEESKKETNHLRNACTDKLLIGISPMDYIYLMPCFSKFHEQYPEIALKFVCTEDASKQVIDGKIDIGITDDYEPNKEIHVMHLYKEEQALAVYADHPWADKTVITFQQLEELDGALFVRNASLIEQLQSSKDKIAMSWQSKFESTPAAILIFMVLNKKGVAILPIPLLECLSSLGFKIIHLMDPTPTRELKLIFQKQQFSNPSVQTFIDYMLELTKKKTVNIV